MVSFRYTDSSFNLDSRAKYFKVFHISNRLLTMISLSNVASLTWIFKESVYHLFISTLKVFIFLHSFRCCSVLPLSDSIQLAHSVEIETKFACVLNNREMWVVERETDLFTQDDIILFHCRFKG